MFQKILIVLIVLIQFSCSSERQIERVIKKNGCAKVVAQILESDTNGLCLKVDTVRIDTVIEKEVLITVKETKYDTIIDKDTINNCDNYVYSDKNIDFKVKREGQKTKVVYNIKAKTIKEIVKVPFAVNVPSKPCPQQAVIDVMAKDMARLRNKNLLTDIWFWLFLLVSVLLVIRLIRK